MTNIVITSLSNSGKARIKSASKLSQKLKATFERFVPRPANRLE